MIKNSVSLQAKVKIRITKTGETSRDQQLVAHYLMKRFQADYPFVDHDVTKESSLVQSLIDSLSSIQRLLLLQRLMR
jgi:hypothetical protein